MARLTPRQQRFVEEYLTDLNGTQAAIRSGYSARTANEQAARLLTNVSVRSAIEAAKAARTERTLITQDDVLRRLVAIATVDVNELVEMRREGCPSCWSDDRRRRRAGPDPDCGSCLGDGIERPYFRDSRTLSPEARALYAGVKVTKEGLQMLTASRDKALELLARHTGLVDSTLKLQHGLPKAGEDAVRAFFGALLDNAS